MSSMLITCCRIIQRTFLSFLTCRLEDAAISPLNVFTTLARQWIKEWYKSWRWIVTATEKVNGRFYIEKPWLGWASERADSRNGYLFCWVLWHLSTSLLEYLYWWCFFNRCVIAELFLEGTSIFSLSQLFKYRSGEYNPDNSLDKIDDENIKVGDCGVGLDWMQRGLRYVLCRAWWSTWSNWTPRIVLLPSNICQNGKIDMNNVDGLLLDNLILIGVAKHSHNTFTRSCINTLVRWLSQSIMRQHNNQQPL